MESIYSSALPTEVIDAVTTGYTRTFEHLSSVYQTIVPTTTVVWESGHAITKTLYETVTECPEAEETSSVVSLPVITQSATIGSETTSTTVSSHVTFASGSSDISSSVEGGHGSLPAAPTGSAGSIGYAASTESAAATDSANSIGSIASTESAASVKSTATSAEDSVPTEWAAPAESFQTETSTIAPLTVSPSGQPHTTLQKSSSAHYTIGTSKSASLVATSSSASATTTSASAVYTGLAISRVENKPHLPMLIGGVFLLANLL